ncbi:FGGY-family carbohydrate kinase [Propioniciclava soli]|uniref:FGGY-family carbohydrate kinase n=1 Tax=Propioniciclava soli TaxID=2775081 RepID=A0ABZ3CCJ3_9ACTN
MTQTEQPAVGADQERSRQAIVDGETSLGIELGSTRIKAVLIGPDHQPLASGSHAWASTRDGGHWTYDLAAVVVGLQAACADLAQAVERTHGVRWERVGGVGVSAMMHGYLAFDADGELLVPFRTWQNTTTGQASEELTALFRHPIPQRWSVAHLYQAVLDGEEHVGRVAALTTLAGHVHTLLTGERVLGVGDASGILAIDPATGTWDARMIEQFDALVAERDVPWRLADLLPRVLPAGEQAGTLTEAGARLLDPSGALAPGCPVAPPEGDAGTGMVATNAVAPRTANVSAGTSVFAMVVLEGPLSQAHAEVDLVTTPAGDPVAMVHCINGTLDLNAWVALFREAAGLLGAEVDETRAFELLYTAALGADADGGGLLAYNYVAGEHVTELEEGRPLLVRTPGSTFSLANVMRTHLYAAFGALRIGMDVLDAEGVEVDEMIAHGGVFATKQVAQRFLAAAMRTPVSVGATAAEGGAWGMALLVSFLRAGGGDLAAWLASEVFGDAAVETVTPDEADVAGFDTFMARYRAGLAIERAAVDALPS